MTTTVLLEGPLLAAHLGRITAVAGHLGGHCGDWEIREIGDGNVNYVYEVRGPSGRLCVKQAMPYVRAVGESWPLTPRRAFYEYRALREHGRLAPGRVPRVVHYDPGSNLLAVEHLAPHVVLREGLLRGVRYPRLAEQLGEYLAATLAGSSDLVRPAAQKRPLVALFSGNTEMTRIMEDMVFTEIYHDHWRNSWTSPQLDPAAARLRTDTALRTAVARLKLRYLTGAEALLHGDLHTGSVLVTEDDTRVIDQEFSCYGPIAFDLGTLLAHLLIAAVATPWGGAYRAWLLGVVEELWASFGRRFLDRWERAEAGAAYPRAMFPVAAELRAERLRYLEQVRVEALGFCGAEMLRRVFGLAHVADLQSIPDQDARAACELHCVELAADLLTRPAAYPAISTVTAAAGSAAEIS